MVNAIKCPSGELLPVTSTPYIFLCKGKSEVSEAIVRFSDRGNLPDKEIPSHIAIGGYGLEDYNGDFMVGEARFPEGAKLKTFKAFLGRNYDSEITAYQYGQIDLGFLELLCSLDLEYSLQDIRKNIINTWKQNPNNFKDDTKVICSGLAALSEKRKYMRRVVAATHGQPNLLMPACLIQPVHYKRFVITAGIQGIKVQ